MEQPFDKSDTAGNSDASVASTDATSDHVTLEPIDEYGLILLETRIGPDGSKRTRKVTRKGRPVLAVEEREAMEIPYPLESDCWA